MFTPCPPTRAAEEPYSIVNCVSKCKQMGDELSAFRPCLKTRNMPNSAGFFRQAKRFDAAILCGLQGKSTQYGRKKPPIGHIDIFQTRPSPCVYFSKRETGLKCRKCHPIRTFFQYDAVGIHHQKGAVLWQLTPGGAALKRADFRLVLVAQGFHLRLVQRIKGACLIRPDRTVHSFSMIPSRRIHSILPSVSCELSFV